MALSRLALAAACLAALTACADETRPAAAPSSAPTTSAPTAAPAPQASASGARSVDPARVQVLATGLEAPWGLAFLPDGDALVSERDLARIVRIPKAGGAPVEVMRLPQTRASGEGGLLGLAVSPTYATDGLVYAYLTADEDNRVVRFRLGGRVEDVLTGIPKAGFHNGGRIRFGPDGMLYVGTGDAGDRDLSQDDDSLGGKVLRLRPGGRPEVFSKGHRNVQGLAFDGSGRLLATEFGQNRFDEVNVLTRGANYGWPDVEGEGSGGGRYTEPIVVWDTSEASPSGADVVGEHLYVAALRGERLWQVPLAGGPPRALLQDDYGRLRAAETAPDGSLWVLTSNRDGRGDPTDDDDRVLRLPPSGNM